MNIAYEFTTYEEAEILKDKAAQIRAHRKAFKYLIGKMLREARELLSRKRTGTFQKWVSLECGISPDTADRYIRAYEFVVERFGSLEEAEDISHNLICFASKISTPEAVKQAVVDRQITTKAQLLDAVNDANERDDASGSAAEPVRQPEIHQKVTTQRNEAGARAPATETKAALRAEIAWAKNAVRCVLVSEAGTVGYSDAMKALQAWADHGRWG